MRRTVVSSSQRLAASRSTTTRSKSLLVVSGTRTSESSSSSSSNSYSYSSSHRRPSPRSLWSIFSRASTAGPDPATLSSDLPMPPRQSDLSSSPLDPSNHNNNNHHNNHNHNNNNGNNSSMLHTNRGSFKFNPAHHRPDDQEVRFLLDSPVGSMEALQWTLATKYIVQALDKEDLLLAFRLLDRMAEEPNAKNKLSNDTVFMVIQQWLVAYAKHQKSSQEFSRHLYPPSTVWRKVEAYLRAGISLESRTCHLIIEGTALVKSRKANSPALAEAILDRMMTLSKSQNPEIRPTSTTFNHVLSTWEAAAANAPPKSQLVQQEAPKRALQLLNQLKTLHAAGWGEALMPTKYTYRIVMSLFAHKGDGDQVEALLQDLYEMYLEHGRESMLPTTSFFSLVLYAWSKSNDAPVAAERAMTLLDRYLELEAAKEIAGFVVNASCFNIVMVCVSRTKTEESAAQVQGLFDRMVELSKTDPNKKPVAGSYAALIHLWTWWDAQKAEDVFWTWKREHAAGNCEMRLDNRLYTSLIAAWFRSKSPDRAQRCDRLIQYALDGHFGPTWEPAVPAFNMTIHAHCQTKQLENLLRAEELLRIMSQLAQTSKRGFPGPTQPSYIPIIHSYSQIGQVERAEALLREYFEQQPYLENSNNNNNDSNDNTATNGNNNNNNRMNGKQRDSDDEDDNDDRPNNSNTSRSKAKLDTKTFNHVLKAWLGKVGIHPEAADRAEDLLLSMHHWGVKPNRASFQQVLDCRRRSNSDEFKSRNTVTTSVRTERSTRAKEVLALLDDEYDAGRLNTDNDSYLQLRQGWSLLTIS